MKLGYSIRVFDLNLVDEVEFYDTLHSDFHKTPQELVEKFYFKLKTTNFLKNAIEYMKKTRKWILKKEERIEIVEIPTTWFVREGFDVLLKTFQFLLGSPLFTFFPKKMYRFSKINKGIAIGHDGFLWFSRPDKLEFILGLIFKIVKGYGKSKQKWREVKRQVGQENLSQVLSLLKISEEEYNGFLKTYEEIASELNVELDLKDFQLFQNRWTNYFSK
ncbi:MAG: hypothetical protein QXW71_02155 [Thermoplasmata archaeon]